MKAMTQATPQSLEDLKADLRTEFITFDHTQATKDKLRKVVKHSSVAKYVNKVRNLVLTVLDMNDGERLDRFWAGLKHQVRLEVLKADPGKFDDAARIEIDVVGAPFGAGMFLGVFQNSGPQYTDIVN